MTLHNISTQAVTWPSPTQYIETEIATGAAGDTYKLLSGVHRMQHIKSLLLNDILEFADGAILNGAEVFSTSGWTVDGATWWKTPPSALSSVSSQDQCRTGFDCRRLEWIIIDDEPKAFVTTKAAVTADLAWYDVGLDRVHIGIDPSTVSTIEIARQTRAFTTDIVTTGIVIKPSDRSFQGVICNYASEVQNVNAAIALGMSSGGDRSNGTDHTIEDMEIRGISGAGIGIGTNCIVRRCKIHLIGQIAVASSPQSDITLEYCEIFDNSAGGWLAGWEGGNMKFAGDSGLDEDHLRGIVRGNFCYYTSHPVASNAGAMWWDFRCDGPQVYGNIIADFTDAGDPKDGRGLHFEINWSGDIHHNILFQTGRGAENAGWAKAILSSNSGPESAVARELPWLSFEDNHIYMCHGGPGGVEGNRVGFHVQRLQVNRNLVHLDTEGASWVPNTGITNFNSPSLDPNNNFFDENLYYVPSTAGKHWTNSQIGGSGFDLTWAQWQADGQDTNGQVITERTHPSADPHPFNGGCLSM